VGGAAGTTIINGVIGLGTGTLLKDGANTATLNDINTFSGTTTLSLGTLILGNTAALGSAGNALQLNGGTLDLRTDASINAYNRTVGGTCTIASGRANSGAAITHTLGTLTVSAAYQLNTTVGSNISSGITGLTFGASSIAASTTIFDVAANANLTLGALSGNFNFTKQNSGQITLNSASTRSAGVSTLSAGTMVLGNVSALGTTATTLTLSGGTLDLRTDATVNAYNTTINGNVSILSGRNTSGTAAHTLGTLSIGNNTLSVSPGNLATGTANLTFGNATINVNTPTFDCAASTQVNLNGTLSHTDKDVIKTGTGTLTLGANAITLRGLTVSAGTLTSTTNTLSLYGNFSSNGTFTHNSGAVSFTGGSAQTIGGTSVTTFNNLTIANTSGGVSLNQDVNVSGSGANAFTLSNGILTTSSTNILNITNTGTTVVSTGSATTHVNGPMTRSVANGVATYLFPVGEGGNYKPLELLNTVTTGTAVMQITLSGAGASSVDGTLTTIAGRNWKVEEVGGSLFTSSTIRLTESSLNTDNLVGRSSPPQTQSGAYTNAGGNFIGSPSGTITSNTGLTAPAFYAIATNPCTAGTWFGITSTWGTNTNWCNNTLPTNTTDVVIPSGVTNFPNISVAGAVCRNITINSGASLTMANPGTLTVSGNFANNGTFTAGTGTVTFDAASGTQTLNSGGSTFNIVTHNAAGTLQLVTNNLSTGTATFTNSVGTVDLNGKNLSTGELTGPGTLDNSSSTASTLTTGTATGASYSGTIQNTGTGTLSLSKIGVGTWTLSGTNSYTGVTTVNAGILSVATISNGGSNSNIGAASNAAANLVLGGGTLQYTGATASTDRAFTLTNATTSIIEITTGATNLTISGSSANTSGALTKTGTGTLTLSGANTYTGATTVSAGTLVAAHNTALGSSVTGSTAIASGAAVHISGSGLNIAEPVTALAGTGSSGTTGAIRNLGNTNTWSGAITLSSNGTIGSDAGTLNLTANIGSANILTLRGAGNGSVSGIISTASVVKNDGGT
jgi:autotransporter-associated beta strand protein